MVTIRRTKIERKIAWLRGNWDGLLEEKVWIVPTP